MNTIPLSAWRTAYAAALFETDRVQLPSRIAEARSILDARLQAPVEIGNIEHQSIAAAQRNLAELESLQILGTGITSRKANATAGA
jgi:hypothetical protein